MHQLDPFIIYTVKLTMDFKSMEKITIDDEKTLFEENRVVDCSRNQVNNSMFPNTTKRIMSMKPVSNHDTRITDKVPKLRRENILSLLYHADEQWMSSVQELNKKEINDLGYVVDRIHRQQRIYLDTLHLLHKTIDSNEPKRFNEPVWFAAQVLYHQCQIRHLEPFTNKLLPLATNLYQSMHQLRIYLYQVCQKQHQLKQNYNYKISRQHKQQNYSFLTYFFSDLNRIDHHKQNFYASKDNLDLVSSTEPVFNDFIHHWSIFEKALYECYVQTVFGKQYYLDHMESKPVTSTTGTLPYELFHDTLTQLLPLTLNRAIYHRRLLDIQDIQSMDPLAFIALPRLALLAGVTWLSHLTGWRHNRRLPHWIDTHSSTLTNLVTKLATLESQCLQSQSHDAHHYFVTNYHALEHALVHGMMLSSSLEKEIYLDICHIADSILSSSHAKSFNRVLCCLFKYSNDETIEFEEADDAVPIEQTILHLAI